MTQPLLTYRGTVYPWQCDHVGHMNVMWYVGRFDEGTWQFFNAIGLTPSYFRSHNRGMAAVDQHLSYIKELHPGAVISVRTTVLEVKDKSIRFLHEMVNDETAEIVARATLTAVHIDTGSRKSCALPEAIATGARMLVTPEHRS